MINSIFTIFYKIDIFSVKIIKIIKIINKMENSMEKILQFTKN